MRSKLLSLLLIVVFGVSVSAQERPAELTDSVLEQLVSRILRYEVKSAARPRTVYVSGTSFMTRDEETPIMPLPIKAEWLPQIRNVEFKLYDPDATDNADGYYFSQIERVGRAFEIGFGYGSLGLGGGYGNTWKFRIRDGKVRLHPKTNGGFGWANDAAF